MKITALMKHTRIDEISRRDLLKGAGVAAAGAAGLGASGGAKAAIDDETLSSVRADIQTLRHDLHLYASLFEFMDENYPKISLMYRKSLKMRPQNWDQWTEALHSKIMKMYMDSQ